MVKRKTRRPFGFVRYRPDKAKPNLAGFNPPQRRARSDQGLRHRRSCRRLAC